MYAKLILAGAISLAAISPVVVRENPFDAHDHVAVANVRITRIALSTGIELQVAQSGNSDGAPVLFLHGYTDSWASFSPLFDRLPPSIRAIAPTQRGHGDSPKPHCCYRLGDFAADAVALLDALGIERATVVGHSMGSLVAQRIAIEHPERVERLVLIGSGTTARTPAVVELNETVQSLREPLDPAFVRDFQAGTAALPLPAEFFERVVGESSKLPLRLWREVLAQLLVPEAANRLERIRARTLIVWGDRDLLFTRQDQEDLLRRIPEARLLTYNGAAHAPNWEMPARFVADLLDFMGVGAPASGAREHQSHNPHGGTSMRDGMTPLPKGWGDWHRPVTTVSAQAQRYFDQGMRLTYAFNHDRALRSFEQATQLDSTCAMCYWGIAYAIGPNINLPMPAESEPRAVTAIGKAAHLRTRVTPYERALIDAMAQRFGEPAGDARARRDSAYAAAMRGVAQRFADDADALVLFADAMLNLRPWNQWQRDGRPQPGTTELVGALEQAIELAPEHAGACHFYVHAVEASASPERALSCAERLPRLMPAAGHVVHMPAHVYLRIGRYQDAARANIAAVEADARYFADHHETQGMYPLFYAPHNLHFLWAAYLLSGQSGKALDAARALTERVAIADARDAASLEAFLTAQVLTLARFRQWDDVLAVPAPPPDLRYTSGIWHYARGLAHAARNEFGAARAELDSLRAIRARVGDGVIIILNSSGALLGLAAEVLAGQVAASRRQPDRAIAHFRVAVRLEDALTYDEPPPWYHAARDFLGEALLDAGRPAEAETVFRENLLIVRENGWSLAGLERALRAQGKTADAERVARRLQAAWQHADVPAPS